MDPVAYTLAYYSQTENSGAWIRAIDGFRREAVNVRDIFLQIRAGRRLYFDGQKVKETEFTQYNPMDVINNWRKRQIEKILRVVFPILQDQNALDEMHRNNDLSSYKKLYEAIYSESRKGDPYDPECESLRQLFNTILLEDIPPPQELDPLQRGSLRLLARAANPHVLVADLDAEIEQLSALQTAALDGIDDHLVRLEDKTRRVEERLAAVDQQLPQIVQETGQLYRAKDEIAQKTEQNRISILALIDTHLTSVRQREEAKTPKLEAVTKRIKRLDKACEGIGAAGGVSSAAAGLATAIAGPGGIPAAIVGASVAGLCFIVTLALKGRRARYRRRALSLDESLRRGRELRELLEPHRATLQRPIFAVEARR